MAPRTRKRKASPLAADSNVQPKKEGKTSNVIGGMNGDYRVTGNEASDTYEVFTVTSRDGKDIPCQQWHSSNPKASGTTLIFTHGAGGGLENPATKLFAEGYASKGNVVCFQGTMNLKSRLKSFQDVLDHLRTKDPKHKFAAGGRSMGARAAVMLAQENDAIKKLILASYPLTSPKGDKRDEILLELPKDKEVLFIIGSNDSMCDKNGLKEVQKKMKATSLIRIVEGADHGMSLSKVPKGQNKARIIEEVRRVSGQEAALWVIDTSSIKNLSSLDLSSAEAGDTEPDAAESPEPAKSTQIPDDTKSGRGSKRHKKR